MRPNLSRSSEESELRVQQLVERNGRDLLAYFVRRVNLQQDAADLVGETFLVVWRRARDVPRDEHDARLWAFGIARRVLSNYWRGRRRRNDLTEKLRQELTQLETAHQSHNVDDGSDVRKAIDDLPDPLRELVVLVHGDGFSIAEAARLLRIPASTARTRYAKAKGLLRAALLETLASSSAAFDDSMHGDGSGI